MIFLMSMSHFTVNMLIFPDTAVTSPAAVVGVVWGEIFWPTMAVRDTTTWWPRCLQISLSCYVLQTWLNYTIIEPSYTLVIFGHQRPASIFIFLLLVKCGDRVIQEEIFDRADKKIVTSRQERSYKQHAAIRNCSMILGLTTHNDCSVLTTVQSFLKN